MDGATAESRPASSPRRQSGPIRLAFTGLTPRGRAFLAAGVTACAAGTVLDQRDLVRVGVLVIALPLLAAGLLVRSRYRISAHRRVDRPRAFVGNVVRVELEVNNEARLPSPLLLAQDSLPPEFGALPGGGARFVLPRIPASGHSTVGYSIRPVRRGRYVVGPLSVRLTDPFGFCHITRTFNATDRLTILPEIVPLPAIRLGGGWASGGESRQHGVTAGGDPDATTRPYQAGDDRRRVHWRTTARIGELTVRREEQPWQSRATVLLDTRVNAHDPGSHAASFEFAVSAAASVSAALVRGGYGVRLIDDVARIVADSHTVPGDSSFAIMDALADIPRSANEMLLPVAGVLGDDAAGRGSIIAVLGRVSEGDATALARTTVQGGRRLAMIVQGTGRNTGPVPGSAVEILTRAGWSVAVVSPASSVESVWWQLTATDPQGTRRWVG